MPSNLRAGCSSAQAERQVKGPFRAYGLVLEFGARENGRLSLCLSGIYCAHVRDARQMIVTSRKRAVVPMSMNFKVFALVGLEQFGPEAKAAVPVLVEFQESDTTTWSCSALRAIDPEAAEKRGCEMNQA